MTKTKDSFIRARDNNPRPKRKIDLIFIFSFIILGIALGYGWRMHHEEKLIKHLADSKQVIKVYPNIAWDSTIPEMKKSRKEMTKRD